MTIPEEHYQQYKQEAVAYFADFKEYPLNFFVPATSPEESGTFYDEDACQAMANRLRLE